MDSVDMQSADMTEAELTPSEVGALIAKAAPGQPPDLSSRRLSGLDLSGFDFKDAKLDGARITANLRRADLRGASLRDADMAADMKNQSMGLMRVLLTSATLDGADLSGARASRADMEFASLRGAKLDRADLSRAKLGGADLTGASVVGTVFSGADVAAAQMIALQGREHAKGMDTMVNVEEAVIDWEIVASPIQDEPVKVASLDDELVAAQQMISDVMGRVDTISTEALKKLVDQNADFVLLDVRTPSETQAARIDAPQHLAITRGWLEMKIFNHVIDKQTPIVTYCGIGIRSAFAAQTLTEMGFTNVRNYEEGLSTWESKGYPVAR
jgi:uncharacterized protein YjbI with pentapeptide repeats